MNKRRDKAGIEKWMFIHNYTFINSYFYQHNKKKKRNLHEGLLLHLLTTVTRALPRIFCIFFAYPKKLSHLKIFHKRINNRSLTV